MKTENLTKKEDGKKEKCKFQSKELRKKKHEKTKAEKKTGKKGAGNNENEGFIAGNSRRETLREQRLKRKKEIIKLEKKH